MRQRPRPKHARTPLASRPAGTKSRGLAVNALGRPWRRWETWLAIVAIFLVSGSLLPWEPSRRIIFAALAFAIIVMLLGLRFANALRRGEPPA